MSAIQQHPEPIRHTDLEQRIKRALDDEERRLLRAITERRGLELSQRTEDDDLGEVASSSQHPADTASETFEREVDFGLIADFEYALDEVAEAKRRLAAGHYGQCEGCDRLVDADRLTAVPATRWCRECAQRVERDAMWLGAIGGDRLGVLQTGEFLAADDETIGSNGDDSEEEAAVTPRPSVRLTRVKASQ